MTGSQRLKQLIHDPNGFLLLPGVVDAMSAILAEQAGFEALFVTGAGLANYHFGLPDLGLVTISEVVERVRNICHAVQVPVIADADTGYGNAMNVVRTVRQLEEAGVAGLMLEDQVSPKRCGHFEGKQVVDLDEMVQKIKAFRYARKDPNLVLIARTDALAVYGFDEAVRRGRAFKEAGADLVFIEAPLNRSDLSRIPQAVGGATVANMVEGGKTPLCSASELQTMGFKAAIFANMAARVAAAAMRDAYQVLRQEGTSASLLDRMLTWTERQQTVALPEFQDLEAYLAGGEAPASDVRKRL